MPHISAFLHRTSCGALGLWRQIGIKLCFRDKSIVILHVRQPVLVRSRGDDRRACERRAVSAMNGRCPVSAKRGYHVWPVVVYINVRDSAEMSGRLPTHPTAWV
jgi:hypothetical protein